MSPNQGKRTGPPPSPAAEPEPTVGPRRADGPRSPTTSRRRARQRAVQALYQWQLAGGELGEVESQFLEEHLGPETGPVDRQFFFELIRGVVGDVDALDALLEPLLDRSSRQLDPVERSILRLGAFELRDRLEIPRRVVINEAIELAKLYGAEQSHRYVNGVLDRLAGALRPHG